MEIFCICDKNERKEYCMICGNNKDLMNREAVEKAIEEATAMKLKVHSFKRTGAVMVKLIFFDVLEKKTMTEEEAVRTLRLFGWRRSRKNQLAEQGLKLLNHYAKGFTQYKLENLPPIWKGLMRAICVGEIRDRVEGQVTKEIEAFKEEHEEYEQEYEEMRKIKDKEDAIKKEEQIVIEVRKRGAAAEKQGNENDSGQKRNSKKGGKRWRNAIIKDEEM